MQFEFSSDQIEEAEIVLASGEILTLNKKKNEKLFWGIRGAANNFGIVTRIVVKLYEIPNAIYGGVMTQVFKISNRFNSIH